MQNQALKRTASVLGNGNWGTTVGKLIAENVKKFPAKFSSTVKMYTYEEKINNQNLSEIINTTHENVKYLPKIKLPSNLIAEPDLNKAVTDADILFFVLPFQFAEKSLQSIKSSIKKDSYVITLAKGVYYDAQNKDLLLLSQLTEKITGAKCYSMMGANIANEVAAGNLCETTIGCDDETRCEEIRNILNSEHFLTQASKDTAPVELLGALKNIYAFGYGMLSQVEHVTHCTLVVMLRMGMIEMLTFIKDYCTKKGIKLYDLKQLTLHSCAYPDLVASSLGGRNSRMGTLFSKDFYEKGQSKKVEEYEAENLNGQKIQGTLTARELNKYLSEHNLTQKYPLMTKIHEIAENRTAPHELLEVMKSFPYEPFHIV